MCGCGHGVDEGGDDAARADTQRGQDLVEDCSARTLRLPRLLVRTAPFDRCAAEAMAWMKVVMTRLGLTHNEAKTSLKNARQERFDFLGYSFGPHRYKAV